MAHRQLPPPWIFDLFNNKDLVDGYLLHRPVFPTEASTGVLDFEMSGRDSSEGPNAKRKTESLFCVMRKRYRGENSADDMDEGMVVDDCCCSENDTDASECSDFDVISEQVLEDVELITSSKSLPICNFPWPSEDEGALGSSDSSGEVYEENFVRSKEDELLSSCIPELCEDVLSCSVNKEDPEIPCNSDIFRNDGDKSSTIEVRCGDVVNMPLSSSIDELRLSNKDYPLPICSVPPDDGSNIETCSLHQIFSCENELRLWNKDDNPITISVVPPDVESSILLETPSLHRIFSCGNEYNVHGDGIGLEIIPIPITKTLEGPSRPWSVCGSLATGKNLHLMEDSSGACSSMDVNVSSEEKDAELAQTPSTLYQDEVDGEDEICFSDIDAMIRKLNLLPDDSDSCLNREEWNMSKHPTHTLLGLEDGTRTAMRRAIMTQRAIAVLHCHESKHFIKKPEVVIGRSSDGVNVDIDLGKYGYRNKISRRQALVKLENYGSFTLKNLGKQPIHVNGEKLDTRQIVTLTSCSSIDIRGIAFMFKVNEEAVRRFLKKNNTKRNNKDHTKFRWLD